MSTRRDKPMLCRDIAIGVCLPSQRLDTYMRKTCPSHHRLDVIHSASEAIESKAKLCSASYARVGFPLILCSPSLDWQREMKYQQPARSYAPLEHRQDRSKRFIREVLDNRERIREVNQFSSAASFFGRFVGDVRCSV